MSTADSNRPARLPKWLLLIQFSTISFLSLFISHCLFTCTDQLEAGNNNWMREPRPVLNLVWFWYSEVTENYIMAFYRVHESNWKAHEQNWWNAWMLSSLFGDAKNFRFSFHAAVTQSIDRAVKSQNSAQITQAIGDRRHYRVSSYACMALIPIEIII